MAVVGRDVLMDRLKAVIGEEMTDDHISLLEDFSDSWGDMETRASENKSEEWKQKYEENDAEWRKRYRDRFFGNGEPAKDHTTVSEVTETAEESSEDATRETTIQIEDLFKEEE